MLVSKSYQSVLSSMSASHVGDTLYPSSLVSGSFVSSKYNIGDSSDLFFLSQNANPLTDVRRYHWALSPTLCRKSHPKSLMANSENDVKIKPLFLHSPSVGIH